jgi:hypothetical protein
MIWTKLFGLAMAAAVLIAAPAPAHADPVPTADDVVAVMAGLTDPGRPAASKTDIVTPGFASDDAGTIDDHLNSLNGRGYLPYSFVVTDIQPADNSAGATVAAPKDFPYPSIPPQSVVLVKQGGRWLITTDTAVMFLNKMWSTSRHRFVGI